MSLLVVMGGVIRRVTTALLRRLATQSVGTRFASALAMCIAFLMVSGCRPSSADIAPPGDGSGADTADWNLPERPFDYHTTTLDNGLQVITLEDHSTPIAAVQLWYHVGSKDERPNRRGFAHMFEHMMFRGTQNIGPKAHFEYIRRVGGTANAYTSFDNTTYIQVVPSNQVEMVMWLEAERLGFLKINDDYFDTERKVVAEEFRMGRERPYGTALEKILAQIFTKHPYRWSPIGDMDELAAADAKELQEFWETYYVPNNAALVVVGDIDHAKVEEMAQRYFGWIPRYPDPPRVEIAEPIQTAPKKIEIKERNGPVPIVALGYRTVPMGHADELALEMLGLILGGGESSRLWKDLVREKDLALFALAGSLSLEDDGLFAAGAVMSPFGAQPTAALTALRDNVARIKAEGVTADEIEKARNTMLRNAVSSLLTVESKAQRLGEAALIEGDVERANSELGTIARLRGDDVKRVANAYLLPEREIEVRVKPNLLGFIVDQFKDKKDDKDDEKTTGTEEIRGEGAGKPGLTRPKMLGKSPSVAPPIPPKLDVTTHRETLDNGLRVVVVPNDEVPFVSARLGFEFGAFADPKDKPGVAFLTLPMLARGTAQHDYETLTELLDRNAISLSGSADLDSASVTASTVSPNVGLSFEMMAEVVAAPTFPSEELDEYRDQTVTGLAVTERSPEYLASRELRRRMFPGHPYQRLPEGTAAGLRGIDRDDLAKWWKTYGRPDAAVLYVAGDVTPQRAFELAREHFGDWTAQGDKPKITVPAPPARTKTKIYIVDRRSNQSQIRVGHVGIPRRDPRYPTARILSEVFGGGFNARLNDTIRVKKGLTYGAGGGFSTDRFAGRFVVSTFSKNPTVGETVETILEEIDRLKNEAPSPREQADAISYVIGSFPYRRETPQELASQLWSLELEGLPEDYYRTYFDAIAKVTSENVLQTANDLVAEDNLVIIVVGPAKVLAPQLRNIAEIEVVNPYQE